MAWDNGAIVSKLSMDSTGWIRSIGSAIGSLRGFSAGLLLAGTAVGVFTGKFLLNAISTAQDFEDQVIQLRKVAGRDFGDTMAASIRQLSRELPVARDHMMEVAASAVRLGVTGNENVLSFVKTMVMIGEVTDMSALQASESFARLAAVLQVPISEINNLASAANLLSDSMATSFAELVRSAGELAPVLSQLGFLPEQILAVAAAQNEVNVSVQRGAQRLRSFFQQVQDTFREPKMAAALNLTREQFRGLVEDSPVEMFLLVARTMKAGGDQARILRDALDSAGSQGLGSFIQNLDGFNKALQLAEEEMQRNNSLIEQFGEYAVGTTARSQRLTNEIVELKTSIGDGLLPLKRGIVGFFASFVGGMNDALDVLFPLRAALQQMPQDMVKATEAALFQRAPSTGGFDAFIARAIIGDPKAVERTLELSNLVNDQLQMLENTTDKMSLMEFYKNQIIPLLDPDTYDIEKITLAMMGQTNLLRVDRARTEEAREANLKVLEQLSKEQEAAEAALAAAARRFEGMNRAMIANVLGSYGFGISELTDQQVRFLLSLKETEIALTQGDDAARRFSLGLENYDNSLVELILSQEALNESVQKAADLNRGFEEELSSIRALNRAMLEGEQAVQMLTYAKYGEARARKLVNALRERSEIEEEIAAQKRLIQSKQDFLSSLRDESRQIGLNEEQMFEYRMELLELTELEKKMARALRLRTKQYQAMAEEMPDPGAESARVRERIQGQIIANDMAQISTQYSLLESSIQSFSGTIVDGFDDMFDGTKKFGDAFRDMLNDMRRELMRMMANRALFQLLGMFMGVDDTQDKFPLSSLFPAAGSNNAALMRGRAPLTPIATPDMAPVTVSFNISSIDSKGVAEMIQEQAPVITEVVTRNIRNSSGWQRRVNA